MVVVKGEVYCPDSDSDDDDDDVDRYVFLARQPAPPAGPHAEDDRGASSANDDEGDDDGYATADEGESERGGGGRRKRRKRPLRGIVDDAAPPPKKARVELIAPPSGSETESDSAALPCDVRAGESGSEGSHEKAHEHPVPRRGEAAKNVIKKKRGACGKRRRGPDGEEDGDRESRPRAVTAAKAGALPAATSGRFLCNLCDMCFDSYQALGGHVLGHRKKARIAIAEAAYLAADDAEETLAGGVAAHRGKANGGGSCDEKIKTVGDIADHRQDGDSGGDEDANGNAGFGNKGNAIAVPGHGFTNGNPRSNGGGSCDEKIKTVGDIADHRQDGDSGGDEDANGNAGFGNKGNAIAVPGHGFTNGNPRSNEKTDGIGASSSNNQKIIHEGANGDGMVRRTHYKCKVCGTECPTGRALGGHMRKHRKRPPPVGGGDEGRSSSPATDDDCKVPLARLFRAEIGLQRENTIGLL